jgi:predicted ATP-grasp superfamily ATP-dependent carboligase
MNGLMLGFAFMLPYHVMRTAAAAGVRVHVLGSGASQGLLASRYCASYRRLADPEDADAVLAEIETVCRRRAIDVILPSDDVSTRLLAGLRGRLPVPSVPLPDLATFDLLNDKGNFTRFCLANGVRVPEGRVFDTAAAVRAALAGGSLALPITVKPTNRSGGIGVLHIRDEAELGLLDRADYRPVLVQRHIVGETVGISVIARDGEILAHATQRCDTRRFELFRHPDLYVNAARLVAATRYSGPANFDAVIEAATGDSYLVECNPRFWFTIYLSLIAGLNFMAFALAPPNAAPAGPTTLVGEPVSLVLGETLRRPWRATPAERRLVRYHLGDPILYALNRARLIDDSGVAVRPEQMTACEWGGGRALPSQA